MDGRVAGYAHVHWVPLVFLPGVEGYVTELFVVAAAASGAEPVSERSKIC